MARIPFCQGISLPVVVVYSAAIKSEQEALVEIKTMPQMSADASARGNLEFARIKILVDTCKQSSRLFKQRDAVADHTFLVLHGTSQTPRRLRTGDGPISFASRLNCHTSCSSSLSATTPAV